MLTRKGPGVAESSKVPMSVPIPVPPTEKQSVAPLEEAAGLLKEADIRWWQVPAGAAIGAGGAYGGWKLIDSLMDWRRKKELKGELDDARNEYEDAMQQQFAAAMSKQGEGAFGGLDKVFDKLHAPMEKLANNPWWKPDWAPSWNSMKRTAGDATNLGLGALLTALGVTTGAGGLAGWHLARRGSKGKATEEAMKLRRMMRRAPQPIYAYPTEVEEEEEIA